MDDYPWPSPYNDVEMPKEFMHAVGCMVLAWNWCESEHAWFIERRLGTDHRVAVRIVEPMGNIQRSNLLRGLIKEYSYSESAKSHIEHMIKCFEICLENRNLIVHSILEPEPDVVVFTSGKSHPNIQHRYLDGDIDLFLRVIAEIKSVSEYISHLDDVIGNLVPLPWPELPPLPDKLTQRFPVHVVERRQPQS